MPTISMFYGIVVYMYLADNKQRHLPHIHRTSRVETPDLSRGRKRMLLTFCRQNGTM